MLARSTLVPTSRSELSVAWSKTVMQGRAVRSCTVAASAVFAERPSDPAPIMPSAAVDAVADARAMSERLLTEGLFMGAPLGVGSGRPGRGGVAYGVSRGG